VAGAGSNNMLHVRWLRRRECFQAERAQNTLSGVCDGPWPVAACLTHLCSGTASCSAASQTHSMTSGAAPRHPSGVPTLQTLGSGARARPSSACTPSWSRWRTRRRASKRSRSPGRSRPRAPAGRSPLRTSPACTRRLTSRRAAGLAGRLARAVQEVDDRISGKWLEA